VLAAASTVGPGFARYAWLVIPFALGAAVLTLFFGKRTPGGGWIYGVAGIGAAFVLSVLVLWHFVQGGGPYSASVHWFTVGPLRFEVGEYVDGLTAIMMIVVTAVSLAVHVYSIGYMHGDIRFTWFYVVLSLFTAAMLNVVIANDLFQLLVGWEIMGLCSYLLIGHWWEEKINSNAAIKAFITTRIGDVPFLFGIFVLTVATGTTNIQQIAHRIGLGAVPVGLLSAAALLLFGGTIGKSAQFPLHVWLPDAMQGPTPVSALIHAATMVAAGVYLVGRLYDVFINASPWVLQFVGIIGGITMFGAALLGLVQNDIKRVLAYSTVSQLAYMVALMAAGPAGRDAAFFHLFTHAFFKALLFLAAGSVIHAVHSNDMSDMGGLWRRMPVTFWTFLIGAGALAGLPPLAGFWSKDELLVAASKGHPIVFIMVALTAVITAFYATRMVMQTFFGEYRGHGEPQESPALITGPLVALAGATLFVGFIGAPIADAVFFKWVYFAAPEAVEFLPWVAAVSILAALSGVVAGYFVYRRYRVPDPITELGPVYTILENKYYLDLIYMKGIVYPVRNRVSAAVVWFDRNVVDAVVNGAARLTLGFSGGVDDFDRTVVDGAVNGVGQVTGFTGGLLRYLQSGNVQRYAAVLFAGVIVLAIIITRI
jgi:NADH-quinone oxidoreductase subunit L